jgi:lysophospholipase L1-like esterase
MFGDSHTANGNWNDLLGRCDVLKLGYSGFTSGQLEFTMKHKIIKRNTSFCFIQCGGNDLNKKDYSPKQMMVNIGLMINYLKANDITPVLQSLFHRPDDRYNLTIDSLNMEIEELAKIHSIDYIDVNQWLNWDNNIGDHVISDKIHLNPEGYEIWGRVIKEYLREKGI